MKEVERAFARMQGLLAKAVQEEDEDDELSRDLDQDLEAYARLKAKAEKAEKDEDEDEDEGLDLLEMLFDEDEGEEPGEDEEEVVTETRSHEEEEKAILLALIQALQGVQERLDALGEAVLQLGKQNVAISKALVGVEHSLDTVALPKSGRRRATAPAPSRNPGEILAKAAQAKDLFSVYDVAALESMLNRGDVEAIYRRFSPAQLKYLGLTKAE